MKPSTLFLSRSKSLNDVSAEELQSLRKIRYEELQRIKEQLQEQDLKWQEVSTPLHLSSRVPLKGWVPPTFTVPRKQALACGQRFMGLSSETIHLMQLLGIWGMTV